MTTSPPSGNAATLHHHGIDMHHHWQPTPMGVDGARLMFGQSFPQGASGVAAEPSKLQSSAHHRMAGMRMAYAANGGLRSVGELTQGHDPRNRVRFAQIARWIATREIIGFMWEGEPWVPMFQFETGGRLQPRRDLQPLFALLIPLYDPWDTASWFARPNRWLSGRRPVDACAGRIAAVLDVAHLEHFIATGQAVQQQAMASGTHSS